jgi:hypothetical protein
MQWGNGCEKEAVYELRQYRDQKKRDPNDTYHIGFDCDDHVPTTKANQYHITKIDQGKTA